MFKQVVHSNAVIVAFQMADVVLQMMYVKFNWF